jgi:hypothetical protein
VCVCSLRGNRYCECVFVALGVIDIVSLATPLSVRTAHGNSWLRHCLDIQQMEIPGYATVCTYSKWKFLATPLSVHTANGNSWLRHCLYIQPGQKKAFYIRTSGLDDRPAFNVKLDELRHSETPSQYMTRGQPLNTQDDGVRIFRNVDYSAKKQPQSQEI